jgi:hypothetical protein
MHRRSLCYRLRINVHARPLVEPTDLAAGAPTGVVVVPKFGNSEFVLARMQKRLGVEAVVHVGITLLTKYTVCILKKLWSVHSIDRLLVHLICKGKLVS